MNRKQFIKEITEKGKYNGDILTLRLPDVLRIADKVFENVRFTYKYCKTQKEVRKHIQKCEGKHTQQAIYSTFHDGLTQICFGCQEIRSTVEFPKKKEDVIKNIKYPCPHGRPNPQSCPHCMGLNFPKK